MHEQLCEFRCPGSVILDVESVCSLQSSAHIALCKFLVYHNSFEAVIAHFYWKAFQDVMIPGMCSAGSMYSPVSARGKQEGPC